MRQRAKTLSRLFFSIGCVDESLFPSFSSPLKKLIPCAHNLLSPSLPPNLSILPPNPSRISQLFFLLYITSLGHSDSRPNFNPHPSNPPFHKYKVPPYPLSVFFFLLPFMFCPPMCHSFLVLGMYKFRQLSLFHHQKGHHRSGLIHPEPNRPDGLREGSPVDPSRGGVEPNLDGFPRVS
jgi:hypothetical protein